MFFIDRILASYWAPAGTPLWRHHLLSILVATLLLSAAIAIGAMSVNSLIRSFIVIVLVQAILGKIARVKFGDTKPVGSAYFKE